MHDLMHGEMGSLDSSNLDFENWGTVYPNITNKNEFPIRADLCPIKSVITDTAVLNLVPRYILVHVY